MANHDNDRTALTRRGARSMTASNGTENGRSLAGKRHLANQDQGGEIAALLGSLRRRWLMILIAGSTVGVSAVALIWFFVEPPFQAASEIRIREIPDRILFKTEEVGGFETYKQTQMRLVKSSFVLTAALRHPEIAQLSMVREREHPIDWLQAQLKVDSPATEFIHVSLEGDRPKELTDLVNAITNAYLDEMGTTEDKRRQTRLNELREVEDRIEDDLEIKRREMQVLAKDLSTTDSETLSTRQQLATEYFGQLRREHAQIRFELMRIQAQIAAKQQGDQAPEDVDLDESYITAQLDEVPQIQQHVLRKLQLEGVIRVMKKRFTSEQHPSIIEMQAEVAGMDEELKELRKQLRPSVEKELRRQIIASQSTGLSELQHKAEVLTVQFKEIEKELDTQKVESNEIGLSAYQLEVQKQRLADTEQMADQIQERIQQIEVEMDAQPRVELFQEATVPHTPLVRRKYKLMGFAGIGGFAFVAGLILWMDLLSKRVSSMTEVAQGLKLRVLGALPIMPRGLIDGRKSRRGARPQALLGIWKESIDSTRTMLLSHTSGIGQRDHQTILVTSAMSGEGKTTLACHLAISLAQSGRKTLLIDADLRRPAIHQVFGISGSPGFSEVLRGEAELPDAVRSQPIEGLFVIPAGQVDPSALQMLAADAAGPLLKELRSDFDFVIVDSAPVLPVTDALMIGPHADGALFAVRRDVSRRGKISSACERLDLVGIPLLGAVVIGLDSQEPTDRYIPIAPAKPRTAMHRTASAVN